MKEQPSVSCVSFLVIYWPFIDHSPWVGHESINVLLAFLFISVVLNLTDFWIAGLESSAPYIELSDEGVHFLVC